VELSKKRECRACLDCELRCRIELPTQQLDVRRLSVQAVAVVDCDAVYSVGVKNEHIGMTWGSVCAIHTSMPQLIPQSKRLQWPAYEAALVPFLKAQDD